MIQNKCVYVFLDHRKPGKYIYGDLKFDFEPIYIGKGNLKRPTMHKYDYKRYKSKFYSKIKSIIEETNKFPDYVIVQKDISESKANELEIEYIKIIRKIEHGGTLTNMCDGGEGHSGWKMSKESKLKKSISMKGRFIGRHLSNETKNKISESKKGNCGGEKNPNYGNKMPEDLKKKLIEKSKGIFQLFNKNGKIIIIDNMKKFCLDNNIPIGCMRNLRSGHSKKYKNWIKIIRLK